MNPKCCLLPFSILKANYTYWQCYVFIHLLTVMNLLYSMVCKCLHTQLYLHESIVVKH